MLYDYIIDDILGNDKEEEKSEPSIFDVLYENDRKNKICDEYVSSPTIDPDDPDGRWTYYKCFIDVDGD